jgi:hypothetical protein
MLLENGFVKIKGASDLEDSSMAAAMCVVFDYPIEVSLSKYLKQPYYEWYSMYQRCDNSKYLFSRDQTLCLVAGLYLKGMSDFVGLERVDGHDVFSPANKGHVKRCQGLKASWFQDLWFWADLAFSAYVKPLEELNQLFCMMMIADVKFMKWYCKANPRWREALRQYWYEGYMVKKIREDGSGFIWIKEGNWRDEKEFCEHMICKIEERIK